MIAITPLWLALAAHMWQFLFPCPKLEKSAFWLPGLRLGAWTIVFYFPPVWGNLNPKETRSPWMSPHMPSGWPQGALWTGALPWTCGPQVRFVELAKALSLTLNSHNIYLFNKKSCLLEALLKGTFFFFPQMINHTKRTTKNLSWKLGGNRWGSMEQKRNPAGSVEDMTVSRCLSPLLHCGNALQYPSPSLSPLPSIMFFKALLPAGLTCPLNDLLFTPRDSKFLWLNSVERFMAAFLPPTPPKASLSQAKMPSEPCSVFPTTKELIFFYNLSIGSLTRKKQS